MSTRGEAAFFMKSFVSDGITGQHVIRLSGQIRGNGSYYDRSAVMHGVRYQQDGRDCIAFLPISGLIAPTDAVYVIGARAYYVAAYNTAGEYVILHEIDDQQGQHFEPKPRAYVWNIRDAYEADGESADV